MSLKYPSQKWRVNADNAEKIRGYLVAAFGREDKDIKSEHEEWRVRFSDATFTYYRSGTLFCTGSNDSTVKEAWDHISHLVGSPFVSPTKDFLIGLDETGKGELLGHTVLVGVAFPSNLSSEIEKLVGVADTKKKRSTNYWDEVLKRLDTMKPKGFNFLVDKIPPWHVDRFNLNKIMDVVYQRVLSNFTREIEISRCRIVLDDYGVGETLRRYLRSLENAGADVKVVHQADQTYLEAKAASVIAKREREKVMEAIARSEEFKLEGCNVGSGNAGDSETLKWLRTWKLSGKIWPWFVKQSFKTVREINRRTGTAQKTAPPIREDVLSEEFIREFEAGRFSITTLSIVCPSCGERSKATLITIDDKQTVGRCISCKKEIANLNFTLRYYCGFLMPDTNIIIGGLLGKDLEQSRFFESYTVLLNPIVKKECDTPGGKREFEKLARFAAMGRIKLQEVDSIPKIEELSRLERDEKIKNFALQSNSILITADHAMKAFAQAKNLFCLHV